MKHTLKAIQESFKIFHHEYSNETELSNRKRNINTAKSIYKLIHLYNIKYATSNNENEAGALTNYAVTELIHILVHMYCSP